MITILMMSGCRRGELMGLKWDRVDFEQGTIRIDNNVLYVPGVGLYEDTPKTEKSKRTIALPPQTMVQKSDAERHLHGVLATPHRPKATPLWHI